MTENEFKQVCSLQQSGSTILISYRDFNLRGRMIGCWENYFVIDVNGQQALWPRELCERRQGTYPIPSYS